VLIRPILPTDAAELAEAIRTADAETLHSRFLGAPPPITAAVLDALTNLDYTSRFALVARARGKGIAVARYAALPPAEDGSVAADVAVAVAPQWRRLGLATLLIQRLAQRAAECGIDRFHATFLAQNRPVVELAHEGKARVIIADGAAQLSARLNGLDREARRSSGEEPGQPSGQA
jgi:GNAT superfamily N-acetyltransferase